MQTLQGIAASPGVAIGEALIVDNEGFRFSFDLDWTYTLDVDQIINQFVRRVTDVNRPMRQCKSTEAPIKTKLLIKLFAVTMKFLIYAEKSAGSFTMSPSNPRIIQRKKLKN